MIPCLKLAEVSGRTLTGPRQPSPAPEPAVFVLGEPPTAFAPSETLRPVTPRTSRVVRAAVVSALVSIAECTATERAAMALPPRTTRPTVEAGRVPAPVELPWPLPTPVLARRAGRAAPPAEARSEEAASPGVRIRLPNRPTGRLVTPAPKALLLPPAPGARCTVFRLDRRPTGTALDPVEEAPSRLPRTARANAAGEDERSGRPCGGVMASVDDCRAAGKAALETWVSVRPAPTAAEAGVVGAEDTDEVSALRCTPRSVAPELSVLRAATPSLASRGTRRKPPKGPTGRPSVTDRAATSADPPSNAAPTPKPVADGSGRAAPKRPLPPNVGSFGSSGDIGVPADPRAVVAPSVAGAEAPGSSSCASRRTSCSRPPTSEGGDAGARAVLSTAPSNERIDEVREGCAVSPRGAADEIVVARDASTGRDEGVLGAGRTSEVASGRAASGLRDTRDELGAPALPSTRWFKNDTIEETVDGELGDTGLDALLDSPAPGAPPAAPVADEARSPRAEVNEDGSASRGWTSGARPASLVALGTRDAPGSGEPDGAATDGATDRPTSGTAEAGRLAGAGSAGDGVLPAVLFRGADDSRATAPGAVGVAGCTVGREGVTAAGAEAAGEACSTRMNRRGAGHISVGEDGSRRTPETSDLGARKAEDGSLPRPSAPPTRSSTDLASIAGLPTDVAVPVGSAPWAAETDV